MSDERILAAIAALRADLGGQIEKVSDDMIDLRVDLMARLDRLQDGMTEIRDDIMVNFGTADAARRALVHE
jgi:hypothetical protein